MSENNNLPVKNNMLTGSLADKLILFALPLAASNILQQLFNSVDVAVAGRFAEDGALGAVGANTAIIALIINLFTGLALGTNVVIATLIGQGRKGEVTKVVHTSVAVGIISGIAITLVGIPIADRLLILTGTHESILGMATLYLRIYFLGMPFIMVYNYGAAILRSIGNTKLPMYALIISGIINTGLNLVLVIVFSMGVAGVAIATVVSNIISTVIVVIALLREKEEWIRLDLRKLSIDKLYLKKIFSIGAPAGLQGALFSFSNVFVQSGINSFGPDATAGSSVGLNFEYFTFYMANAFTQASITFAGQNYGAGNLKRCRKICRQCIILALVFTEIMAFVFGVFRTPFASLYTPKPAEIEYAVSRMMNVMMFEGMVAFYEVPGGVMRAMGHSYLSSVIAIFGTVVFRLVWMGTVFVKWHSFEMLMIVYPVSWILITVIMLPAYFIVIKRAEKSYISK